MNSGVNQTMHIANLASSLSRGLYFLISLSFWRFSGAEESGSVTDLQDTYCRMEPAQHPLLQLLFLVSLVLLPLCIILWSLHCAMSSRLLCLSMKPYCNPTAALQRAGISSRFLQYEGDSIKRISLPTSSENRKLKWAGRWARRRK